MSDFIEQEVSATSPPESSAGTPTASDSHPDTNVSLEANASTVTEDLTTPEAREATHNALKPYLDAPWLPEENIVYVQDTTEPEPV